VPVRGGWGPGGRGFGGEGDRRSAIGDRRRSIAVSWARILRREAAVSAGALSPNPARFGALAAGLRDSRGVDSHASGTHPSRECIVAHGPWVVDPPLQQWQWQSFGLARLPDVPFTQWIARAVSRTSFVRTVLRREARDSGVWPADFFCHSMRNLLNAAMAAPLGSRARQRPSQAGGRRTISAAAHAARPRGSRGIAVSGRDSDSDSDSDGGSSHCFSSRLQV
jgi:hypothetical protein